jgi:hypothetical protein
MPSRSKTQSLSVEPLPERRESEDYEGKDDYGDEKREKKHDNKRDVSLVYRCSDRYLDYPLHCEAKLRNG